MQSSRKKRISVNTDNTFDLVNFEEFHINSESSSNDNEKLTSSSLLFDHYNEVNESGDDNWLFRALSRGITCTPNYHGSIRNTVVQHINDNIERYQDFYNRFKKYIYIYIMFKQGTWGREAEIQTFTEVYSVNVYVHELESTLEPSYKYLISRCIYTSN